MADEQQDRIPTQARKPWRAVFRTLIVIGIAMIPFIQSAAVELGIDNIPWIAATLALAAGLQRALSVPAVEIFLQQYAPWLSAIGGYVGKHRGENNDHPPTPTIDGGR